jgi:hypothetical protein
MINNIPESNKWINITDFFYMHLFTMRSQCFKSVIQSGRSLFLSKIKNTSLKWPVGVSPLQLVNLHRNQRYFVIKLHTWFCLIFLEDKHKILLHITIFYEYQQFFQHCICFSIQPPDYSDPWPRLARSTSFFLIMLFNKKSQYILSYYFF